jgi:hypothetical protein
MCRQNEVKGIVAEREVDKVRKVERKGREGWI